jgi:hypothetical protein
MYADKIYYPEQIDDQSLPLTGNETVKAVNTNVASKDIYTPVTEVNKKYPEKFIAHETVSQSIDTLAKKIKGEFSFGKQGAVQIGEHVFGESGEIKMSSNGITAKNLNGEETFALDATTGDAVFKGIVKAADFVIADENGLVSAAVFQSDSYFATTQVQKNLSFSYEDITGSDLSFTLVRPAKIIITFFANVKLYATDPFRGYYIDVAVAIDGVTQNEKARFEVSNMNADLGSCLSFAKTYLLADGAHTIKLRWAGFSDGISELNSRGLDYCMLGS